MDAKFLRQLGSMGEPHMASAAIDLDTLTPLADMVLVRRLPEEEKTASGLILPQSGRDKREGLRVGVVLRVGRGDRWQVPYSDDLFQNRPFGRNDTMTCCIGPDGKPKYLFMSGRHPMSVKPGDRVVYARCPDNDVRINGEDLVLLREEQHVLAVLEED